MRQTLTAAGSLYGIKIPYEWSPVRYIKYIYFELDPCSYFRDTYSVLQKTYLKKITWIKAWVKNECGSSSPLFPVQCNW